MNLGTFSVSLAGKVIQKILKERGVDLISEADEESDGPAILVPMDPEGNANLIDRHI